MQSVLTQRQIIGAVPNNSAFGKNIELLSSFVSIPSDFINCILDSEIGLVVSSKVKRIVLKGLFLESLLICPQLTCYELITNKQEKFDVFIYFSGE